MLIECSGHQFALYLWHFVMLFVYRCKREYYLSDFKVLLLFMESLLFQKPNVSSMISNVF